jgi:hypothetical protein
MIKKWVVILFYSLFYFHAPFCTSQLSEDEKNLSEYFLEIIKTLHFEQWNDAPSIAQAEIEQLNIGIQCALQKDYTLADVLSALDILATGFRAQNNQFIAESLETIKESLSQYLLEQQVAPVKNSSSQQLYQQATLTEVKPSSAIMLIADSYFSPEMQYPVLELFDRPMIVDKQTGVTQNIPTIKEILNKISSLQNMDGTISIPEKKEAAINALNATQEAIEIAFFVAKIEAAYNNPEYIFYQNVEAQLADELKSYQQEVSYKLEQVNPKSMLSWFLSSNTSGYTNNITPQTRSAYPTTSKQVLIDSLQIKEIILKTSFKLKTPHAGANLLFQQVFLAQRKYTKYKDLIELFKLNINPAENPSYFDTAPTITTMYSYAKKFGNSKKTHELLLDIRQAVQTAMFIANKKSAINLGSYLPTTLTSYFDSVITELMNYDAILSEMVKDKNLGATDADLYRDQKWDEITKVAAGLAITAVALGTGYYYGPSLVSTVSKYIPSWGSSTPPTDPGVIVAPTTTSPSSWWNPFGSSSSSSSSQDSANTQAATSWIGSAGKTAETVGITSSMLGMAAHVYGQETGNKNALMIGNYATKVGAVGTGIGSLHTAAYKITNIKDFWSGCDALLSSTLAINNIAKAADALGYPSQEIRNQIDTTMRATLGDATINNLITTYQVTMATASTLQAGKDVANISYKSPQSLMKAFTSVMASYKNLTPFIPQQEPEQKKFYPIAQAA